MRKSLVLCSLACLVLLWGNSAMAVASDVQVIRLAMAHDPGEIFGFREAAMMQMAAGAQQYIGDGYQIDPTVVTYEEIAGGRLTQETFDAAYFPGGLMIAINRPSGFDEQLRAFAAGGGAVIGHCGGAAAFAWGGVGLLEANTDVSTEQVVRMVLRVFFSLFTSRTGLLRPVSVDVPADNPIGLEAGVYDYTWDGGVRFSPDQPAGIIAFGEVIDYDVRRRYRAKMLGRPFFICGEYEGTRIILVPGSPEQPVVETHGYKTLAAEIRYVLRLPPSP